MEQLIKKLMQVAFEHFLAEIQEKYPSTPDPVWDAENQTHVLALADGEDTVFTLKVSPLCNIQVTGGDVRKLEGIPDMTVLNIVSGFYTTSVPLALIPAYWEHITGAYTAAPRGPFEWTN